MDDLISRQAAIDDIEKHIRTAEEPYQLTDTDRILNHAFDIAASCVYNLPSAQPEQQWIPCSERLPKENTIVLATTADFMYIVEFEIYSNGHIYWNEVNEYRSVADVIAWMPLPEPYKEGEA